MLLIIEAYVESGVSEPVGKNVLEATEPVRKEGWEDT
jgi:hypothetical protein